MTHFFPGGSLAKMAVSMRETLRSLALRSARPPLFSTCDSSNAVDQTAPRNIYNSSIRPSSSALVAGLAVCTSWADLDLFEADKTLSRYSWNPPNAVGKSSREGNSCRRSFPGDTIHPLMRLAITRGGHLEKIGMRDAHPISEAIEL